MVSLRLVERNRSASVSLILFGVILLDQLSKFFVVNSAVVAVCNTGHAFGIRFGGQSSYSLLVSVFVLLVVGYFFFSEKRRLQSVSLALVLGGGVSNLFDRLFRGCVVDFISIGVSPSFNVADSAITIGVILLIYSFIFAR